MPKRYAREFRRAICERLVAGERISKLSEETGSHQRLCICGSAKMGSVNDLPKVNVAETAHAAPYRWKTFMANCCWPCRT